MDGQDKPLGSSTTSSQTPSSVPPSSSTPGSSTPSTSSSTTPLPTMPGASSTGGSSTPPPSSTESLANSGIPQPHNTLTDSGMVPPPKHGTNPLLIVGIIFLIVAVLGGAVFFAMMQNQQAPAEQPIPAAPTVVITPTVEVTPTESVSTPSGTTTPAAGMLTPTVTQDNATVTPTNLNQ